MCVVQRASSRRKSEFDEDVNNTNITGVHWSRGLTFPRPLNESWCQWMMLRTFKYQVPLVLKMCSEKCEQSLNASTE